MLEDVPGDEDIMVIAKNGDVLGIEDVGFEHGVGHVLRVSSTSDEEE
jgi:hypothetical protein